jgi:ribonuclease P protein component
MLLKETPQRLTFKKRERLKSRKTIETLFVQNKSIKLYPFKLVWLVEPNDAVLCLKMGVSVSKRQFKTAVKRNLIKRKMRECLRINKSLIHANLGDKKITLSFMIIFMGSEVVPYSDFDNKIKQLLIRLSGSVKKELIIE